MGAISAISSKELDVEMASAEGASASDPATTCSEFSTFPANPLNRVRIGRNQIAPASGFGRAVRAGRNIRRRCRITKRKCLGWSIFVACLVSCVFSLLYFMSRPRLLELEVDTLLVKWYWRRADWKARPAKAVEYLTLPLSHVIVVHSATPVCYTRKECKEAVLDMQESHMKRGRHDIGPNFLLGGNGLLFEGRGANVQGSSVAPYDTRSISIMFIGDYCDDDVAANSIYRMFLLLDALVRQNVLQHDFYIYGKCQLDNHSLSPGKYLLQVLKVYFSRHWASLNEWQCYRLGFNTTLD